MTPVGMGVGREGGVGEAPTERKEGGCHDLPVAFLACP